MRGELREVCYLIIKYLFVQYFYFGHFSQLYVLKGRTGSPAELKKKPFVFGKLLYA
jgi:hypothetical protein